MTKKLLENNPLKYSIVRNIACLDPRLLLTNKCLNKTKLYHLLLSLTNYGKICENDCDNILKEYDNFIEEFSLMDCEKRFKDWLW